MQLSSTEIAVVRGSYASPDTVARRYRKEGVTRSQSSFRSEGWPAGGNRLVEARKLVIDLG